MVQTVADWQRKIDRFLVHDLAEALAAIEYEAPPFGTPAPLATLRRARVACRHADGASDAIYRIEAFAETLTMLVQLNVWRLVIVYSLPETDVLDMDMLQARLERWQIGAQHAGWQVGWRRSVEPEHRDGRIVQIYCYAFAEKDLLDDAREQLYWRTDIVQMTRALMLEARQAGVALAFAST